MIPLCAVVPSKQFSIEGDLLVIGNVLRMSEISHLPRDRFRRGVILVAELPDGSRHVTGLHAIGCAAQATNEGNYSIGADPHLEFVLTNSIPKPWPESMVLWWFDEQAPLRFVEEVEDPVLAFLRQR